MGDYADSRVGLEQKHQSTALSDASVSCQKFARSTWQEVWRDDGLKLYYFHSTCNENLFTGSESFRDVMIPRDYICLD
jgi:uncharacterized protein YjlB